MKRNRRLLIGLAIGVAVFAASFGMAASLGGLTTDQLGAEDAVVATCETSAPAPDVSYTTEFVDATGYVVTHVVISDLDDTCEGQAIKVTLTGAGGTELLEDTGETVPADSATTPFSVDVADTELAEEVLGVHVLITG